MCDEPLEPRLLRDLPRFSLPAFLRRHTQITSGRAGCRARHGLTCVARAARLRDTAYWCLMCGWLYEEAAGAPEEGIAPGTKWEDVPDDWKCPNCEATKAEFVLKAV